MHLRKRISLGGVLIDMTPMIDVVFQLLAFFLMTFQVAAVEGDFNVKMPLAGPPIRQAIPSPTLHLRLTANPEGELSAIALNGQPLDSFSALQARVVSLIGTEQGPNATAVLPEVELDCDRQLGYRYVIDAVTAVSGKVSADGNAVKLLDKIRFAPRRSM